MKWYYGVMSSVSSLNVRGNVLSNGIDERVFATSQYCACLSFKYIQLVCCNIQNNQTCTCHGRDWVSYSCCLEGTLALNLNVLVLISCQI